MKAKTVDAFTSVPCGGNAAGVQIIDGEYPDDKEMLAVAAEMGYSETAFIRLLGEDRVMIRYFTPAAEVDLCGHATIASFFGLTQWGLIQAGKTYTAITKAGEISVDIGGDGTVWMDMAAPAETGGFTLQDELEMCTLFGISQEDMGELHPSIVSTGLADIMMPVKNETVLANLQPDMDSISAFSKKHQVTGFHVFALGDENGNPEITAHARNFAPLYDIPEEAATGTSNGALTYYLYRRKLLTADRVNLVIQGEAMNRPSEIRTMLHDEKGSVSIRVGGRAAIRE